MTPSEVPFRWLRLERSPRHATNTSSSSTKVWLRRSMRTILGCFEWNTEPEALDALAIGESDLVERPTVVFAPMPEPAVPGQKAIDILIQSPGIRLLLANPLTFVVFVSAGSRQALDAELHRWIRHSTQHCLSRRKQFQELGSATPVGWAFLTADELTGPSENLRDRLHRIEMVARSCLYDPSGLRSLLHLLIAEGVPLPAAFGRLPPLWAVLVEDEKETAARLATLVRRWGYSVLVVDTSDTWRWVHSSGTSWLEAYFELGVADNVLGFEGRASGRGHAWLRRLRLPVRVFKSAIVPKRPPPTKEIHLRPEVADAFQLRRLIREGEESRDFGSSLFTAVPLTASPDLHSEVRSQVVDLGHRLLNMAARLEKDQTRVAALTRLEAFSLVERLDGPMAADALSRFHVFEVETLCDRAPENLDQELLEERLVDLLAGISRCFEEPPGAAESLDSTTSASPPRLPTTPRRADSGLWMSRALTRLKQSLRPYPISARLHQIIEIKRREQRRANYNLMHAGEGRLASQVLAGWNAISRWMVSLRRVFFTWAVIVLVFGTYYGMREAVASGVPLESIHLLRGLAASLSCGIGFLYPHVYNFSLGAELYVVEFVQRTLAVVLLARAIELISGWLRYGS